MAACIPLQDTTLSMGMVIPMIFILALYNMLTNLRTNTVIQHCDQHCGGNIGVIFLMRTCTSQNKILLMWLTILLREI
jgi:hypothetical protein